MTYQLTDSIVGHIEKKIGPLYTISELAEAQKEQWQLLLAKVRHRMQELQQQEDRLTTLGELKDIQDLCLDPLNRIDESAQVD